MIINFKHKFGTKKFENLIMSTFENTIKYLNLTTNDLEININFVSGFKIKKLNQKFRNVNKVTDILSFPTILEPNKSGMQTLKKELTKENFMLDINMDSGNIFLGDLIINFHQMKKQAKLYNNTINREVSYLVAHGILHLLGYDHIIEKDKKIMRKCEEEILKLN